LSGREAFGAVVLCVVAGVATARSRVATHAAFPIREFARSRVNESTATASRRPDGDPLGAATFLPVAIAPSPNHGDGHPGTGVLGWVAPESAAVVRARAERCRLSPNLNRFFRHSIKRPIVDRRTSSQILIRFLTHELRAENSIRFLRIALDWTMAVEMASKAAHQSNVFWLWPSACLRCFGR